MGKIEDEFIRDAKTVLRIMIATPLALAVLAFAGSLAGLITYTAFVERCIIILTSLSFVVAAFVPSPESVVGRCKELEERLR